MSPRLAEGAHPPTAPEPRTSRMASANPRTGDRRWERGAGKPPPAARLGAQSATPHQTVRTAVIGEGALGFGGVVAGLACQARAVGCGRMPNGPLTDFEPRELELRHQPSRRLAVLVMVMGTRISVIAWIGLYGGTVVVGVGINGSRRLA